MLTMNLFNHGLTLIRYKLSPQKRQDIPYLWTQIAHTLADRMTQAQGRNLFDLWIPGGNRKVMLWQTQQSMIEVLGTLRRQQFSLDYTPALDLITRDDDTDQIAWDVWGSQDEFERLVTDQHKYILIAPDVAGCFNGYVTERTIIERLARLKQWAERTKRYIVVIHGHGTTLVNRAIDRVISEIKIEALWDIMQQGSKVCIVMNRTDGSREFRIKKDAYNQWYRDD